MDTSNRRHLTPRCTEERAPASDLQQRFTPQPPPSPGRPGGGGAPEPRGLSLRGGSLTLWFWVFWSASGSGGRAVWREDLAAPAVAVCVWPRGAADRWRRLHGRG